jgi:hypothetical protein
MNVFLFSNFTGGMAPFVAKNQLQYSRENRIKYHRKSRIARPKIQCITKK